MPSGRGAERPGSPPTRTAARALSNRDRGVIAPLLLAVITATLVSRTLEPRSIYDARLDPAQARAKLAGRSEAPAVQPARGGEPAG